MSYSLKFRPSAGTVDLYVLPFLRVRTWPGPGGRLRPLIRIDDDDIDVESPLRREDYVQLELQWFF